MRIIVFWVYIGVALLWETNCKVKISEAYAGKALASTCVDRRSMRFYLSCIQIDTDGLQLLIPAESTFTLRMWNSKS